MFYIDLVDTSEDNPTTGRGARMGVTIEQEQAKRTPADRVLAGILREISVPGAVLAEARRRRDLVLRLADDHPAGRDPFVSGSVAQGSANRPLEDADGGIKMNRRFERFREFGPDVEGGRGPEGFIQMFAEFIVPRLREAGYPRATVNLDGNRAIKLEFNEEIEIDDWGPVDPYVDLIVGLSRADGSGLWIPNRAENGWDAADPELHTWLLAERDLQPVRVHRVHLIRLAKRAIKRDDHVPGRAKVMCSWNVSALALETVNEAGYLAGGLLTLLSHASRSISDGLTNDPSPVVQDPIALPDGVTQMQAAQRLAEMAEVAEAAFGARSEVGARAALEALYGPEIDALRAEQRQGLQRGLRAQDGGAVATALGMSKPFKPTRSDGSRA